MVKRATALWSFRPSYLISILPGKRYFPYTPVDEEVRYALYSALPWPVWYAAANSPLADLETSEVDASYPLPPAAVGNDG